PGRHLSAGFVFRHVHQSLPEKTPPPGGRLVSTRALDDVSSAGSGAVGRSCALQGQLPVLVSSAKVIWSFAIPSTCPFSSGESKSFLGGLNSHHAAFGPH